LPTGSEMVRGVRFIVLGETAATISSIISLSHLFRRHDHRWRLFCPMVWSGFH
jgi:hypothetical protein